MYSAAVADFQKRNGNYWQTQSTNTFGVLQKNGDFIFAQYIRNYRRLVRTSNSGAFIKAGYIALAAANWEKSENWKEVSFYRVTNFTGIRSKNK